MTPHYRYLRIHSLIPYESHQSAAVDPKSKSSCLQRPKSASHGVKQVAAQLRQVGPSLVLIVP